MRGTIMVAMWTLILLALSISLRCQSVLDAPSAVCGKRTIVTYPNGTVDNYTTVKEEDVPCAQGTPWRVVRLPAPKPVGYWTFRRSWQDPPLRTNRAQLTSRAYYLSAILGDTAMIVACSRRNSREDWHSEVPSAIGVDVLAFLGGKYFTQSFAVGPQLYKIIHYSIAAAR